MKTNLIITTSITLLFCICTAGPAKATNYSLTLSAQGSGTVTPDNTNSLHPAGVIITVTATPSLGWYFANWSGNASGNTNPLPVTMTGNLVITGNFLAYPTYSLALATNGQGTIALNPSGGSYYSNTLVTATATPAPGWVFAGWSGITSGTVNPVSFPVNANNSLTGSFAQLPAFDAQPASVTTQAGATVSFTTSAVGTAPLSYQWYFSDGTLTNATNPTLSLTNVTTFQTGNYWVVASNYYGSVTSIVASLTLTNSVGPTNLVSSINQASLQAAIAQGGWIGMDFNGTLTLTNTIIITNQVVLDGNNFSAIISGGNAVRLFYVTNGASLTLSNLSLANGYYGITSGPPGTPADAGAIYNNGGSVTLAGCTLTNNSAQSLIYGGLARGGAIFNNGGSVALYQSLLNSNLVVGGGPNNSSPPLYTIGTGLGGAIYNTNGVIVITGCSVNGNTSQSVAENAYGNDVSMGGAIYQSSGTLNITNSSISFNRLAHIEDDLYGGGGSGFGGAIAAVGGNLSMDQSIFATNQAVGGPIPFSGAGGSAQGGAIYASIVWTANDCNFIGNQSAAGGSYDVSAGATASGGGIYNSGTLTLNRCTVILNGVDGGTTFCPAPPPTGGAALGGGIFNEGQLIATNCTITLNSVIGGRAESSPTYGNGNGTTGNAIGGGVYNSASSVLMNLTIASNSCSSPTITQSSTSIGGLAAGAQIANASGTLSLLNCIIAYGGTNNCAYGTITDLGYNICSDASASLDSGSSYNDTDPQLAPLGNYGGPTPCMALLASSPAIDNADPADFPATDQRGYWRPIGGGPDMGAYEYGSVPILIPGLPTVALNPSGTNLLVSFTVYPNTNYRLQFSTNLVTWSDVLTNGPVNSPTSVSQTLDQPGNQGFFRVVSP
jgi:hypothetical protein